MSYAVGFRKKSGLDIFGKKCYAQGAFWSNLPWEVGSNPFVISSQFSTPMEVEVIHCQRTGRLPETYIFRECDI